MRAPIFDDNKFSVLSKDLKGPLTWLRKQSILKRISDAQEKINNLSSTMLSGNGLLDQILKEIAKLEDVSDLNDRRRPAMKNLALKFADLAQKRALHYPVSVTNVLTQLRSLYAVVDIEQLKADFAAEFAGVETFDPNQSIVELDFEIELAESEIGRVWPKTAEELGQFYQTGRVPSMWEGHRVAPVGDPKRDAQAQSLTEVIMVEFFSAWKSRQAAFQQKVTLGGILIHTLPSDIRPCWESLFAAAGMKTGSPVYRPIIHDTFIERNNSKPQNKMFERS